MYHQSINVVSINIETKTTAQNHIASINTKAKISKKLQSALILKRQSQNNFYVFCNTCGGKLTNMLLIELYM